MTRERSASAESKLNEWFLFDRKLYFLSICSCTYAGGGVPFK